MRTSFFLSVAAIFVSIASAAPLRGDLLEAREPVVKPVADYIIPSDIKREEDVEERGYSMYGWKRDSVTPTATATPTPAAPKKVGPVEDFYYGAPWKREEVEEEKREEEERGYSMYGWKRQESSASATPTPAPTKPKAPVADTFQDYGWKREDDAPEAAKRTPEEESQ